MEQKRSSLDSPAFPPVSSPLNLSKPKKEDNNNQIGAFFKPELAGVDPASADAAAAAAGAFQFMDFFRKTKGLLNGASLAHRTAPTAPPHLAPPHHLGAPHNQHGGPISPQLPDVVSTLPMFPQHFKPGQVKNNKLSKKLANKFWWFCLGS